MIIKSYFGLLSIYPDMPPSLNKDHQIGPPVNKIYFVSADHRLKKKDKSRWTIPIKEEIACFTQSHTSKWIEVGISWGVKSNGASLADIGVNSLNEPLKLAKFIGGAADRWHGYPADYIRNTFDRPGTAILLAWNNSKLIEKHQIIKIRQGKPCSL